MKIGVNRFKQDPNCRLFLSTDAGSVGLNLQVANIVINLVCENSIEHRMLYLLEQKQLMTKGVLTGDEALKSMKIPSGRAAFMERMEALMADQIDAKMDYVDCQSEAGVDVSVKMRAELVNEFNADLESLHTYQSDDDQQSIIFAVVKNESQNIQDQLSSKLPENTVLETIDQNTLAAIQRLEKAGILTLNTPTKTWYDQSSPELRKRRRQEQLNQSMQCLSQAVRKQRMVKVLIEGDFSDEARSPLKAAFSSTVNSLLHLAGKPVERELSLSEVQTLIGEYDLPDCFENLFSTLMLTSGENIGIQKLFDEHQLVINHLAEMEMDKDIERKEAFNRFGANTFSTPP